MDAVALLRCGLFLRVTLFLGTLLRRRCVNLTLRAFETREEHGG